MCLYASYAILAGTWYELQLKEFCTSQTWQVFCCLLISLNKTVFAVQSTPGSTLSILLRLKNRFLISCKSPDRGMHSPLQIWGHIHKIRVPKFSSCRDQWSFPLVSWKVSWRKGRCAIKAHMKELGVLRGLNYEECWCSSALQARIVRRWRVMERTVRRWRVIQS